MPPAPTEAVTEFEAAIGFPMPPLLRRLYLEVSDGCFGRWWSALPLTDETLTKNGYLEPELMPDTYARWQQRSACPTSVVPLLTGGCAIWSLVDFGTAEGRMWGWDPNVRCEAHAIFPEKFTLADRLTGWLDDTDEFPEPPDFTDCAACSRFWPKPDPWWPAPRGGADQ